MKVFNKLIARYLFSESDSDEQREVKKHIDADESLANEVSNFRKLLSMKLRKPAEMTS